MAGKYWQYFRCGAQSGTPLERLHKSLNQARGTAYSVSDPTEADGTAIDAKNYAYAKAINEIWNANIRLANQFDPNKMGVFLSRWEKILGLVKIPTDTLEDRKDYNIHN